MSQLQDFLPLDFADLERRDVLDAVEELANSSGPDERGAVFTRREVVDFVLDLAGYSTDRPLYQRRLLEPSFGGGDFLLPAVERLLPSWRKSAVGDGLALDILGEAIRAVELHRVTFDQTRTALVELLRLHNLSSGIANALADRWLIRGDFLLSPIAGQFDFVVGNPPYVRQELIPEPLLAVYRNRYRTLFDRADLYVPFIERSLSLLAPKGHLGFICSDRWMKNRYGGPLRAYVAANFRLKVVVDMVDTPAFHSDVIAYPAIMVISREAESSTRIASRPEVQAAGLKVLAQTLRSSRRKSKTTRGVHELAHIANGSDPWLFDASDQLSLLRRLEGEFPLIEEAGCRVGIGVATGADKAFIGNYASLDVEVDRKLPLVTTKDIASGQIVWRGQGVINPFTEAGELVRLEDYPKLARHLEARRDVIAGRHVAQKMPANWYRTIDRITPSLTWTPKLLIPDIKGDANVVYEPGQFYPHHNLYFIVSGEWDLRALQAVLLSGIARMFVALYSVKMRGGYLRFQAQYLRRIRIPEWRMISEPVRAELIAAAEARDLVACNQAVVDLYRMSPKELSVLVRNGA